MFGELLYEKSSAAYEKHILLIEEDEIEQNYCACFERNGFRVIRYRNDLEYRINHEEVVKAGEEKILLLTKPGLYIP